MLRDTSNWIRIKDAEQRYKCTRSAIRKLAEKHGAVAKLGTCVLIDAAKLDRVVFGDDGDDSEG